MCLDLPQGGAGSFRSILPHPMKIVFHHVMILTETFLKGLSLRTDVFLVRIKTQLFISVTLKHCSLWSSGLKWDLFKHATTWLSYDAFSANVQDLLKVFISTFHLIMVTEAWVQPLSHLSKHNKICSRAVEEAPTIYSRQCELRNVQFLWEWEFHTKCTLINHSAWTHGFTWIDRYVVILYNQN